MRSFVLLAAALPLAQGVRIIQANDDGWAEANLRTLFYTVTNAGYESILSAPAENESGNGSLDAPPTTVGPEGCEHDSCPPGSPPTGANATDPRLNYVNSYPVTSMKNGISVTAPKLWNGSAPDIALSGPNVGLNTGLTVQFSGTVGAAVYAAKTAKIPAIAFSGKNSTAVDYKDPTPLHSQVYADAALNITTTLINSGKPYLPDNAWLNVNFPDVSEGQCSDASQFKYIFTRINSGILSPKDANWCGTTRLPTESSVIDDYGSQCYATISPGDATDKTDINDPNVQMQIINKLKPILSCLPSSK